MRRLVVYADDPEAGRAVFRDNPALVDMLSNWAELDVSVSYKGVVLGNATSPLLVLGVASSLGVALLRGRAYFRSRVRPLLLANPVALGGSAFACRVCGAPLAAGSDVTVTCRHCDSMNLIPIGLHAEGAAALARHDAEAVRRIQTAQVRVGSIATRMEWIAGIGIGIAVTVALSYLAPALVMHATNR